MPKCAFQQHPVALFRWPEMSSCRWWLFGPMGPAFAVQNFSTVLEMHFHGSKCTRLATGDADVSPHHEHRCACPRPVLQRSPRGALQVQERWCSAHLILVFGTILLCRERHLEPRTVFTVGVINKTGPHFGLSLSHDVGARAAPGALKRKAPDAAVPPVFGCNCGRMTISGRRLLSSLA